MNVEGVALLMLGILLLMLNLCAIWLFKKWNVSFWVSGIVLLLASYPLGLFLGAALIKVEHHVGGVGTTAAFLSILYMITIAANALVFFVAALLIGFSRVFKSGND